MKYNLTKKEIRHAYNNDEVFLWLRDTINERFPLEANLIGASNSERLWQIRGHAEILKFFNDIDRLLDFVDIKEDDESD
jgi:hypothetical protein